MPLSSSPDDTVEIGLLVLPHGAGLDLPAPQTSGAAGADLRAALDPDEVRLLAPGQRMLVPCGFAMALPEGYEAQVRPRSGLAAKHGVTVLNAPGTIDADYRGEVQVILINHGDTGLSHPARRPHRPDGRGAGHAGPFRRRRPSLMKHRAAAGGFGSTGHGN